MGVYGYGTAGMKIPEGYLQVKIDADDGRTVEQEILYPANPGSVYHMTKTLDQLLFAYYNKNDGVQITDLHQGIVWGTQTEETRRDERLINRFDYDGDYGTVLNRFLMQAAIGYPLTVHGTGGQTRAFIHIQDTVRCIELAVANPPQRGERVNILNQMTETHRVRDLAQLVAEITGADDRHASPTRATRPTRTTCSSRTAACSISASSRSRCPRACCARSPRSPRSTPTAATATKIPCRVVLDIGAAAGRRCDTLGAWTPDPRKKSAPRVGRGWRGTSTPRSSRHPRGWTSALPRGVVKAAVGDWVAYVKRCRKERPADRRCHRSMDPPLRPGADVLDWGGSPAWSRC